MSLNHVEEQELSDYLDVERTAGPSDRAVGRHLSQCPVCQDRLEQLRATTRLLRDYGSVPAPRHFSIPEGAAPRLHFVLPAWGSLASLAASLLLFLAVAGTYRSGGRAVPAALVGAPNGAASQSAPAAPTLRAVRTAPPA